MTTEEFFKDIERQKEKAYGNAYLLLVETLEGKKVPDRTLVDIAKYIIDRRDGKPIQKQQFSGDKEGLPILIKIFKDDRENNQALPKAMGSV